MEIQELVDKRETSSYRNLEKVFMKFCKDGTIDNNSSGSQITPHLNQPNLLNQVSLSARWFFETRLLIDIFPFCLGWPESPGCSSVSASLVLRLHNCACFLHDFWESPLRPLLLQGKHFTQLSSFWGTGRVGHDTAGYTLRDRLQTEPHHHLGFLLNGQMHLGFKRRKKGWSFLGWDSGLECSSWLCPAVITHFFW